MDENQDNQEEIKLSRSLDDLTTDEVIRMCGKAQVPFHKLVQILESRLTLQERAQLLNNLQQKGSYYYNLYTQGISEGEFEMSVALHNLTLAGEKDAYKNLNAEMRKRAINESLAKNFGLGEI